MTFTEALIASGYKFDSENFDDAYVKTDSEGFIHIYQEGEDESEGAVSGVHCKVLGVRVRVRVRVRIGLGLGLG